MKRSNTYLSILVLLIVFHVLVTVIERRIGVAILKALVFVLVVPTVTVLSDLFAVVLLGSHLGLEEGIDELGEVHDVVSTVRARAAIICRAELEMNQFLLIHAFVVVTLLVLVVAVSVLAFTVSVRCLLVFIPLTLLVLTVVLVCVGVTLIVLKIPPVVVLRRSAAVDTMEMKSPRRDGICESKFVKRRKHVAN